MKNIILLISAFVLFSCGSGLPSEEMAFEKFKARKASSEDGAILFEYSDFKKLNGQKMNMFGVEAYEMEYSVKKTAKQNIHCYRAGAECFADTMLIADSIRESRKEYPFFRRMSKIKFAYKKGEFVILDSGHIAFEKKENGWD